MISNLNTNDLYNRLAQDITEPILAVPDMAFGNIYRNEGDLEYYTISKNTGDAFKLDRFKNSWEKTHLTIKFFFSSKWRKVNESI